MSNGIWQGVHSAITTKFDEDEAVDLAAVAADVAFQIEGGVDGIICCGSLGEASTLVADEKIAIAGVVQGLIRLAVGLEHPHDICADLARGLDSCHTIP